MNGSYALSFNQSENNRLAAMYVSEGQNVVDAAALTVSSPNRAENKVAALFAPIGQRSAEEAASLSPSDLAEIERVNAWAAPLIQRDAESAAKLDLIRESNERFFAQQVDHKKPKSSPHTHTNMKQRQWTLIGSIAGGALIGTIAKMFSSMTYFGMMMSSLAGMLAGGFASYHLYSTMKTQS